MVTLVLTFSNIQEYRKINHNHLETLSIFQVTLCLQLSWIEARVSRVTRLPPAIAHVALPMVIAIYENKKIIGNLYLRCCCFYGNGTRWSSSVTLATRNVHRIIWGCPTQCSSSGLSEMKTRAKQSTWKYLNNKKGLDHCGT